MTFPFQPHHTSSEDDAFDQQLNDLVSGADTNPENELAADALEFHRWADETRRTDPAATGPAAGTFDRVLRNSAQESLNRSSAMSSATLAAQSPGVSRVPVESFRQRSSRYATLAATVALVLAVALGGWLALSQMPGGDGDGRFAALQGTPEVAQSQTCDVEPMTVDEVMEIVKNPYAGMSLREGVSTVDVLEIRDLASRELVEEGGFQFDPEIIEGESSIPSEASFAEASTTMNEYLGCLQVGNVGQIFRFFDPRQVQQTVLSEYPVFRDEAKMRDDMKSLIDYPAHALVAAYSEALHEPELTYAANPNRDSAALISYSTLEANLYDASQIVLIGVRVSNPRGEIIFQNDAEGRANPIGPLKTTDRMRVLLAESSYTGDWFVLALIPE